MELLLNTRQYTLHRKQTMQSHIFFRIFEVVLTLLLNVLLNKIVRTHNHGLPSYVGIDTEGSQKVTSY